MRRCSHGSGRPANLRDTPRFTTLGEAIHLTNDQQQFLLGPQGGGSTTYGRCVRFTVFVAAGVKLSVKIGR